jgi:hypothetical protein
MYPEDGSKATLLTPSFLQSMRTKGSKDEYIRLTETNGASFGFKLGDEVLLRLKNRKGVVRETLVGTVTAGVSAQRGRASAFYEIQTQDGLYLACREVDLAELDVKDSPMSGSGAQR